MDLGSGIRKKPIPDPGSRSQKGTGSGSATLLSRHRKRQQMTKAISMLLKFRSGPTFLLPNIRSRFLNSSQDDSTCSVCLFVKHSSSSWMTIRISNFFFRFWPKIGCVLCIRRAGYAMSIHRTEALNERPVFDKNMKISPSKFDIYSSIADPDPHGSGSFWEAGSESSRTWKCRIRMEGHFGEL